VIVTVIFCAFILSQSLTDFPAPGGPAIPSLKGTRHFLSLGLTLFLVDCLRRSNKISPINRLFADLLSTSVIALESAILRRIICSDRIFSFSPSSEVELGSIMSLDSCSTVSISVFVSDAFGMIEDFLFGEFEKGVERGAVARYVHSRDVD